ncbi:PEP_CTERM-anchored TLD domain-containing protein [Duganella radicis]|uniref:PEP-CTERM sorting domain-containing protein n=1 Tax=Duganella radicis TaxID=551988 RepID=A0A6L6PN19_9BURK|nr:PEP_CTERM-anchored TLD domain-containing protein [Duganella radicis]MTV40530.1 PEP-CTERM sorting domain-containing protein [Duganella radicis]
MERNIHRGVVTLLLLASVGFGACANAATPLLTAADEAQLTSWLGEGSIKLTNIYTKTAGDTSASFHAAADGKGRTFAVMQASNAAGETWLVGGYNPQSWSTTGSFNITDPQSARTGFLFNLTNGTKHAQVSTSYVIPSMGSYQTLNDINYGPAFGAGNDLAVTGDMTHGLSLMYSYMDESGNNFYRSLLDNSIYETPNVTFGAIEIYTISSVPEPTGAAMLLAGMAGLALLRRRLS